MTRLSPDTEIQLRIVGMTCGACVSRVEGALRGVSGVRDAAVNLLTESARVTLGAQVDEDTDKRSRLSMPPAEREALLQAVREAGYDAEVIPGRSELLAAEADDPRRREHVRRHRQSMIVAIGLTLPILGLDHLGPMLSATHGAGEFGWRLLEGCLVLLLLLGPAGAPMLAGGARALWHRAGNMDLLISMGVSVAFVSSVYGTFTLRPEYIHYHAAAMIVSLVTVGRYLEARARGRASAAIAALARRAPTEALVRRGGEFVRVALAELRVDEIVSVPPHHVIPADGEVVEGEASVDESLMTGEPLPRHVRPGDRVVGGVLVLDGALMVHTSSVGAAAVFGRIVRLVAEAQRGRTHMQRLADRVAAVFTPIVVAVAAVVFASWLASGRVDATEKATRAAVAVLVVACPCALGLATPTVVLVASGLAALRGILVRNAASLERLGQVRLVVWDKTGTLTNGRPMVDSVTCFVNDEVSDDEMVRLAASAEMFAAHPLARAIVSCARRRGIGLTEPSTFASSPGGGVRALVENRVVLVGSMTFIAQNGVETGWLESAASGASREGHSVAAVAVDGQPVGLIFFKDAIRPSAAEAIRRLRRLGIRSVMLTGDREVTARAVAAELGIEDVYAEATPEQKVEYVHDLKEQRASARAALRTPMVFREPRGLKLSASCRSRDGLVAMVGDGVNDAAALSAADVGIAFATGADVAVEAAEINLIGSTPHLVADAVELSRSSVRVIRQNLFWAFAYNVLMIPLAAVGVVPPWMAAGAMMLSSLTVVGNALRLPRVVGWSTAQVQAPGKHVMNI